MTLNGWDFATRFRDVIHDIAASVVDQHRPAARYATVVTINRTNRSCTVRFPGETNAVTVPMGSIQPAQPGQTVRIMGTLGDRYIDDVMGAAVVQGSTPVGALVRWPTGVTVPSDYVAASGQYLDPAVYPTLFTTYGFTQGQQGTLFRVPTEAGYIIRAA